MTRHSYTPLDLRHIDAERRFYLGQMMAHMGTHKQWAETNMDTMSPQAYSDCAELQGIMGSTVAAYLNDTASFIAWREWEEDHTEYSRDQVVQVPQVNALVDHLSAQLHIPTSGAQTILPYRRPSWWQRAKNWLNTPIG